VLFVDSENYGLLAVNRYVECFETNVNTIYAETLLSHRMVLPLVCMEFHRCWKIHSHDTTRVLYSDFNTPLTRYLGLVCESSNSHSSRSYNKNVTVTATDTDAVWCLM
jgi:hypothetical protein